MNMTYKNDSDSHIGLWLFLFTEILVFGGLFILFSIHLSKFPNDFLFCSGSLDFSTGAIDTVILLSALLTLLLATSYLKKKNRTFASLFLSASLLFGVAFLISRVFEWSTKFKWGHTPGENTFYSLFYLLTGLHGLYVFIGIILLAVILFKVLRKNLEVIPISVNYFWYLVCGIWVFIFPLFYAVDISPNFLPVLPFFIFAALLLHLPYLGVIFGSSALSVVYRKWKPDLSKDFINLAVNKLYVWFIFGFLPPIALSLLYKLLLKNTPLPIHLFFLRIMILNTLGFILLYIYRRTGHIIAGAAGALAILRYCFHFIDITSLLLFPEKWFFLKSPIPYPLFSITPLFHFAEFILLSFIITGAAILFFFFTRTKRQLPEDSPHYIFMKRNGYALMLVGSLPIPLIMLPDLFNLPGYALSIPVFILSAMMIIVLCAIAFIAFSSLLDKEHKAPHYTVLPFILALVLFGLMTAYERVLETNSNIESVSALQMDSLKKWNAFSTKHQDSYSQNMAPDEKLGEQIFNDRCSACHSFDKIVLGPPYNSVLPKYIDKQDELIAFIKNPRKINPLYPPMPNPDLTSIQVKSVVKFLMNKISPSQGVKRD